MSIRRRPIDGGRFPVAGPLLPFALHDMWPTPAECDAAFEDLFGGLLEAGRFAVAVTLLRAVGVDEGDIWLAVERACEERDDDVGEVFASLYEPEGLGVSDD